jgi:RNA polymerase sigma-70 factor (ECF subfamily)
LHQCLQLGEARGIRVQIGVLQKTGLLLKWHLFGIKAFLVRCTSVEKMTDKDPVDLRRGLTMLLPRLRRFGAALAGSNDEGDDIVHAAIERALSRSGQWQPGTRLDSWMFRIMQNIWKDRRRRLRTDREKQTLEMAATDLAIDGQRVTETSLMLTRAREQFARLSDDHRMVLALVVIDGHSYQEAADILEIPVGTLMSRLYRARETLREMIETSPNRQALAARQ